MADVEDHPYLRMGDAGQEFHPVLHRRSLAAEVLHRDGGVGALDVPRQLLVTLLDDVVGRAGMRSPQRAAQLEHGVNLAPADVGALRPSRFAVDADERRLVGMVGDDLDAAVAADFADMPHRPRFG